MSFNAKVFTGIMLCLEISVSVSFCMFSTVNYIILYPILPRYYLNDLSSNQAIQSNFEVV